MDSPIDLLTDADEQHWSLRFRAARRDVLNRDASGRTRIIQAYGGMGSFSDLVIRPQNRHAISSDEIGKLTSVWAA